MYAMSITVTIGITGSQGRCMHQKEAVHVIGDVACEVERTSPAILWRPSSAVPVVLSQVLASPQAAIGALHGALRRLVSRRRCRQRA